AVRSVTPVPSREDGVLVKPDAPLAALDHCFRSFGYLDPHVLIGETYSNHPAGRWVYVLACSAGRARELIAERCALAQLGAERPLQPVWAYEWRSGRWTRLDPDGGWAIEVAWQEWERRALWPALPGERGGRGGGG